MTSTVAGGFFSRTASMRIVNRGKALTVRVAMATPPAWADQKKVIQCRASRAPLTAAGIR